MLHAKTIGVTANTAPLNLACLPVDKASMSTTVDLNNFCDLGHVLMGESPADEFGALNEDAGGTVQTVSWHIRGFTQPIAGAQFDKTMALNARFLAIQASTQVQVSCVRCLNPMIITLEVDTVLQVFQDDAAADAAAMGSDADLQPDPIVTARQFDLLDQVQEELLLAMPDNPAHEDGDALCVLPVMPKDTRNTAFSVLASLKQGK